MLHLSERDAMLGLSDGDAAIMAPWLAAGISSGAHLVAALLAQDQLDPTAVVATIFSDEDKKYREWPSSRSEKADDGFTPGTTAVTDPHAPAEGHLEMRVRRTTY